MLVLNVLRDLEACDFTPFFFFSFLCFSSFEVIETLEFSCMQYNATPNVHLLYDL